MVQAIGSVKDSARRQHRAMAGFALPAKIACPRQQVVSLGRPLRGAFTLLELVLVLAIMVMIATLVTPNLTDILERQRVKGAADLIRIRWDEARLKAMRTGQAQVFHCEPGTGSYEIKPLTLQADATNAGAGATLMVGAGTLVETDTNAFGAMVATAAVDEGAKQLEDNITFVSCMVAGDMRSYSVAQQAQTTGTGTINTQTVGQSVVFYPDGSTSTAELRLQNQRGDVRAVRLRGLTGQSSVVSIANVASNTEEE